jgi:hypothetical protein
MNPIYDRLDVHRIFTTYPLPEKYQNQFTNIKIIQHFSSYEFSIVAVNPELPPLVLDLDKKEWVEQKI